MTDAFQASGFQPYAFQEGILPGMQLYGVVPGGVVAWLVNIRLRGWTLMPNPAALADEVYNPLLQPPSPSRPQRIDSNPVIGH